MAAFPAAHEERSGAAPVDPSRVGRPAFEPEEAAMREDHPTLRLNATEARGGETLNVMRFVLSASILLTVLGLGATFMLSAAGWSG